ncbi:MAG TPA: histidine kinase [Myxococcales bacterium]|nr:histidine kinase [Myxococcales bacterium]
MALVWAGAGLFVLLQSAVIRASSHKPQLQLPSVLFVAESVGLWLLFTPLIWWLSERFPFDRKRLRATAVHLAAALLLLVLDAALNVFVVMPALGLPRRTLVQNAADLALIDLLCYVAVVAFEHGRRYRFRSLRLESDLREARLQALEAQLRPHFLFNALNTISSLVRARQDQSAIRAVAALGDVLRGALRQTEAEVALRDELLLAERYLDLERARFGEALSFSVNADPDTGGAQVPSLLLQPLVENALKHGREPDGRAHVAIRVQRSGDDLRIEVRDGGSGPRADAPDGIGLSNTRARLQHLYGERGRFSLRPAQGGGALALVELPLREAPHA